MTTPVNNDSGNATAAVSVGGLAYPVWGAALIAVACSLIVIGTIVGNILVCTAVSIVRKLRTPSNWLIVSLAVADLLVGLLVMPLAIVYEVRPRQATTELDMRPLLLTESNPILKYLVLNRTRKPRATKYTDEHRYFTIQW